MDCETKHSELSILRHGETWWNLKGKFQGRMDLPLTKMGKAQALHQQSLLASICDLPSKYICSPQGRALHTARLALGADADLMHDDRLQEIDFGKWEGATRDKTRSQIDYPFATGLWNFRRPQRPLKWPVHGSMTGATLLHELRHRPQFCLDNCKCCGCVFSVRFREAAVQHQLVWSESGKGLVLGQGIPPDQPSPSKTLSAGFQVAKRLISFLFDVNLKRLNRRNIKKAQKS
ncbi:histidine phosphatase family protein [Ruegeria sp. ANG10]|uniref:histidine phosphatase family protein n=1 Tax=Ruegeria sp. ANG10 TaxID=3042467 RepID=UPI003455320B